MNEDLIEQLIWQEIDGVNTPEESKLLFDYFSDNPGARECYEEALNLVGLLDGLGELDPPPALRERIYSAAAVRGTRRRGGRTRPVRALVAFLRDARYAYVAAGFVLGIICYALIGYKIQRDHPIDVSDLYGTMNLNGATQRTGRHVFALDGIEGVLDLIRGERVTLIDIRVASQPDIELVIDYERESLRFDGFRRLEGESGSLGLAGEGIAVRNRGAGRYLLVFESLSAASSPVELRILSAGSVVYHKAIYPD